MTFYVIVGLGPNSVEIPALVFSTKAKAEEHLHTHTLRDIDSLDGDAEEEAFAPYFTHYYGGCGSCDGFKIVEVGEGKPFVCWDLD